MFKNHLGLLYGYSTGYDVALGRLKSPLSLADKLLTQTIKVMLSDRSDDDSYTALIQTSGYFQQLRLTLNLLILGVG